LHCDPVEALSRLSDLRKLAAAGNLAAARAICDGYFCRYPDYRDEHGHPAYLKESLRLALASGDAARAEIVAAQWRAQLAPSESLPALLRGHRASTGAGPAPVIRIRPRGRHGNHMFQYMFARMLQARVPRAVVQGYFLPDWKLVQPADPAEPLPEPACVIEAGHRHDLAALAQALNDGTFAAVDFAGYAQRLDYYPDRAAISALFVDPPEAAQYGFDGRHLAINIRAEDIEAGLHRDYMPLPLGFYRDLVASTGLQPAFFGQTDAGSYMDRVRAAFPAAEVLPPGRPQHDFAILRHSVHVVPSLSTFAWLGSWLSHRAGTVHLPVCGLFNPEQRPDVHLLPTQDERYRFYAFPVTYWHAGPAQEAAWYDGTGDYREITRDEAARMVAEAKARLS
jgi:hypothetical protein